MCGIAGGCWGKDASPLAVDDLRRMTQILAHRGPDDFGLYHSQAETDPGLHLIGGRRPSDASALPSEQRTSGPGGALGHRRLSIIDLAGGHQPLSNEDGTVWIAFNGEIYNYRELRPELEAQGHVFRTDSDTETIVHLYEQYGPACVERLRGMFAFALWDDRAKRLFLARDRLGKKPLFYRAARGQLTFASELKGLLQVTGAPREIDPHALDAFLTYQYVPHPQCIFKRYQKLPPAHWLMVEDGTITVRRYWSPPYQEGTAASEGDAGAAHDSASWKPDDWRRELRATLTEAVRLRMRSDVPLGAFLSGGIDSTIITGLMQSLSDRPVKTFSIGFPVKQFDERSYAREAAAHLKTEHHELVVEPKGLDVLPKLVWHYDEPFGDSSAIPTMALAELTRKHVTVALSGDGGDELFAGYDRYQAVRLAARFDRLPRPLRAVASARIWQRIPSSVRQKSFRRKIKRFLAALGEPPERRYLTWVSTFDATRRRDLLSDSVQAALGNSDPAEFLLAAYRSAPTRDFVTRTTCADVLTYLPCDILTKVDIATMASALEARCPFLDHRVAELAARMPLDLKLKGRRGKRILLDTFSDFLPASIQTRKKMGFGVPLDHWFRGELQPLLRDTLLSRKALDRDWFKPEAVQRLVDEHTSSTWDHSYRLWSLLVFELWQRTWCDS
ncbi:MAG: asparagine synthase (glutamine-hydrolyzing) [Planctomycetaceae bacterium]|nr:asparagine synthase (glutamine-hydrolyzing) [Planctomycetaceae bacterium]